MRWYVLLLLLLLLRRAGLIIRTYVLLAIRGLVRLEGPTYRPAAIQGLSRVVLTGELLVSKARWLGSYASASALHERNGHEEKQ
jgi:hypothetical protein